MAVELQQVEKGLDVGAIQAGVKVVLAAAVLVDIAKIGGPLRPGRRLDHEAVVVSLHIAVLAGVNM